MKKILFFVLAGFAINAMADNVCVDHKKNRDCSMGVVNGMTYRGNVHFDKTTVSGLANLQGNTDISNATFDNLNLKGNASVTGTQVNTMSVKGNVYAKNVTVKESTNVLGKFYAANTNLPANSTFVGIIDCDHCLFEKNTSLFGDVVVSDSESLGSLNLDSGRNAFYQSKLNDVVMKKSNGKTKQIISLNHGTTVKNIRFETKGGMVMLDDSSTITGTVEGGTVVKVKG